MEQKVITFEEVKERLKNKSLKDYTDEDILDRYIVYGTEEELNIPEIQQLLIQHNYTRELLEVVDFITDKGTISGILNSNLLKNENIIAMQGQAEMWVIEHLQELKERTLSFEIIIRDTGERTLLKGATIFSQEDYNKYRKQFYKYQNNLIAIVEKVGEEYKLLGFLAPL